MRIFRYVLQNSETFTIGSKHAKFWLVMKTVKLNLIRLMDFNIPDEKFDFPLLHFHDMRAINSAIPNLGGGKPKTPALFNRDKERT